MQARTVLELDGRLATGDVLRVPARVHSVFDRAANLSTAEGLVALVEHPLPIGPATIVLAPGVLPTLDLVVGASVDWTHLDLAAASIWSPEPVSGHPHPLLAREAHLDALSAHLADRAATDTDPFAVASRAMVDERAARLGEELAQRDAPAVTRAAAVLLGLGQGLTPAGDDVLCGVLLTLLAAGETLMVEAVREALVDAADRTTAVASSMLAHALGGLATEPLMTVVGLLTSDDTAALSAALRALTGLGHSSGRDLLSGVVLALRSLTAPRSQPRPLRSTPLLARHLLEGTR